MIAMGQIDESKPSNKDLFATGSCISNNNNLSSEKVTDEKGSSLLTRSTSSPPRLSQDGLRMVEFFSGIGGMRYGVERALDVIQQKRAQTETASVPQNNIHPNCEGKSSSHGSNLLRSCVAYEISLQANATYAYNFGHGDKDDNATKSVVHTRLVEHLKPKDLDGKADLWTMSPPCQPFTTTRNAKQCDASDKRTRGFKALMNLLQSIQEKPMWILLENVKGFVGSEMLQQWYMCLHQCGYTFRELLLNPIEAVGIPNNRTRYYMICERSNRWEITTLSTINSGESHIFTKIQTEKDACDSDSRPTVVRPLSDFVQHVKQEDQYTIPDNILQRPWAHELPVVTVKDKITRCFTAAYGRIYHNATGSFLLIDPSDRPACADVPIERRSDMSQLYSGKLRRFTPDELLAIFGFPSSFQFPSDISLQYCYKLIGNSVNIFVVAQVAAELLKNI